MMNDVLHTVFKDRIISRRADVVWPSRSCDLIPLDYYLWDAIKDKCYADKPETIKALKQKFEKIFSNICYCMASRGSHLNEIIFYYKTEGLYFQIKKEVWENIQQFFLSIFQKKCYLADLKIEAFWKIKSKIECIHKNQLNDW